MSCVIPFNFWEKLNAKTPSVSARCTFFTARMLINTTNRKQPNRKTISDSTWLLLFCSHLALHLALFHQNMSFPISGSKLHVFVVRLRVLPFVLSTKDQKSEEESGENVKRAFISSHLSYSGPAAFTYVGWTNIATSWQRYSRRQVSAVLYSQRRGQSKKES